MAAEETKRSIPSLDGLRALAVCAVILGHSWSDLLDRNRWTAVFRQGPLGVAMFFVISGFLITHLLLKELDRDDDIDIRNFYLRRTFRIFPPFYVFLGVICVLKLAHFLYLSWGRIFVAATYTWNYSLAPETWVLGHSWSLALEEQFYLLWPACIKFFDKRTNLRIAAAIILLSPLSRILTYLAVPPMRAHIDTMLHTHLDTIMVGCLLSLMINLKKGERLLKFAENPAVLLASVIFLFAIDLPAKAHWAGKYFITVGISAENIAIACILLFCVFRHNSVLGKFLNLKPIRHIGVISYSLYLWQQLFNGPYTRLFPLNIVWIFLCAELSYFLVERPSFKVRDRFSNWLKSRKALPADTAAA